MKTSCYEDSSFLFLIIIQWWHALKVSQICYILLLNQFIFPPTLFRDFLLKIGSWKTVRWSSIKWDSWDDNKIYINSSLEKSVRILRANQFIVCKLSENWEQQITNLNSRKLSSNSYLTSEKIKVIWKCKDSSRYFMICVLLFFFPSVILLRQNFHTSKRSNFLLPY